MEKEMFLAMKEIATDAEMLGFSLLLENRCANLIKYDKNGKVKSSVLFGYDDPNCIHKLRSRLDKAEQKKRKKWMPEFQRIIPAIQSLNWSLEPSYAKATIVDDRGYVAYYAYDRDGVISLSDDISDYLLNMHAKKFESDNPQPTATKKPAIKDIAHKNNATNPANSDDSCLHECQRDSSLIATLWYNIDEKNQQKLMESLSPEKWEEIERCLQGKD